MTQAHIKEAQPLARALGFKEIWAIGVGCVIGDGIFIYMGYVAGMAGPMAIIPYFTAGFLLMCIMISMGELAVGMPSAGSMWVWNRRFMGDYAGFLSAICYAAGWIIAGGSVGLGIGFISTYFYQVGPTQNFSVIFWGLLWVTVFFIVNYLGVVVAIRTQLIMVLALVGAMVVYSLIAYFSGQWTLDNYVPFNPGGWGQFFPALAFGTYAYMGALSLTTAGSECKNPADLPRALVWASITFLVVYTLAMGAMFGLAPYSEMSIAESPFVTAFAHVFGRAAGMVVNIAAWVAAATCILAGTMYTASRILYGLGSDRMLPPVFAQVNKYRVPGFSTILIWIISCVLILLGTFYPDLVYVILGMLLVFSWAVTWILGIISGILYRKRFPDEVKKLAWKQPLYPLFPTLAIISVGIIFYGTFRGAEVSILYGVIFLILMTLYYFAYGKSHVVKRQDQFTRDA